MNTANSLLRRVYDLQNLPVGTGDQYQVWSNEFDLVRDEIREFFETKDGSKSKLVLHEHTLDKTGHCFICGKFIF